MASRETGTVTYKKDLSPTLTIFRLISEGGSIFPAYTAGQYVALGRDDARLTKKVGVDPNGRSLFAPDLDETGRQRIGPVMHSLGAVGDGCARVPRILRRAGNGGPRTRPAEHRLAGNAVL